MKVKLAEALLRRKELQEKVNELRGINQKELYDVAIDRRRVTEQLDDIVAKVPKITMQQVTHCYDWHAKQLRLVDAAIQQANWTSELDVDGSVMADYIDPYIYIDDQKWTASELPAGDGRGAKGQPRTPNARFTGKPLQT